MEQMNRETKRRLQRAGQLDGEGAPAPTRQRTAARPTPKPGEGRTKPTEFLREVRVELKKVAWPTRKEVINYSGVVLFTLVLLTSLIFFLDLGFSKLVLFLFK